ncbi:MAG: response regulator [Bacillota bacterium]|nr:response regulator [Bacillota bacterium]
MKTILVDDEIIGLRAFEIECGDMPEIDIIGCFSSPVDVLPFAEENRVDLALLDIKMPKLDGLSLSDSLRELYPDIIIIFVSAYGEHMPEAFKIHKADYFVAKPYTREEVKDVLYRAKLLSARQHKKVKIHTFGTFEVFCDSEPVRFTSPKAKELLAILVDAAGRPVSTQEAFELMWENIPYNHKEAGRYRQALQKLQRTLTEAGIENILHYFPHARSLRTDMVECDYFSMMDGDKKVIRDYSGAYMSEYSWSEERIPKLNKIKLKEYPDAVDELYG